MSRGARFIGVGAVGFVVQALTLHTLVTFVGVAYPLATALAVEAAILHNFVWHERWTWADRRARPGEAARAWRGGRLARLLRFNGATALVSMAGNVVVTAWLVDGLHVPLLAANTVAVLALSAVNFAFADRVLFAPMRSADSSAP